MTTMGSTQYDFSDETVIVTGGGSGIGRATALGFGEADATVLVADVREEPRDEGESIPTHELIEERDGRAEYVETDVSDPEQIEAVVEAARGFGGIDIMVNNAGIFRGKPLLEEEIETLDTVFEINVRGTFAGCRAAARDMLDRETSGCIINTASISSEVAQIGHAVYDASKGAIMMFTRVAALELAHHDIRVNAVAPGPVKTKIGSENESHASDIVTPIEKETPMKRRADPEEIAGSYLFLASDDASYVTGHLLYADGGYSVL